MQALAVVIDLYVLEHRDTGVITGGEAPCRVDELAFQGGLKALDQCVVKARAFARKTRQHLVRFEFALIDVRDVLSASIAMMDQVRWGFAPGCG